MGTALAGLRGGSRRGGRCNPPPQVAHSLVTETKICKHTSDAIYDLELWVASKRSLDGPGVGIQAGALGKILFSLVALRFCVPQFPIYVTKTLDKTNAIQSVCWKS